MNPVSSAPVTPVTTAVLPKPAPTSLDPRAIADTLLLHAVSPYGPDIGQLRAGVSLIGETSRPLADATRNALSTQLSPLQAGALTAAADEDSGGIFDFIIDLVRSFSADAARAEGATFASDLDGIASPSGAPSSVTFTSGTQNFFDRQWDNSLPGGYPDEQGGTLVFDRDTGLIRLVNLEGGFSFSRGGGTFTPDRYVGDSAEIGTLGVFHTHPYSAAEGGYTGVSFSGGDFAAMFEAGDTMEVVQSGDQQFMLLRTEKTPTNLDPAVVGERVDARFESLLDRGYDFAEASNLAAEWGAREYGLAYYEGSNGTLNRVTS